ncbi:MAG: DedA family protein [Candidatus Saccharimonadia bacterium]
MQSLASFATKLIGSFGYFGLALGLVIDSAGIPIPSEVLLPLAGALAREAKYNLVLIIVVATIAQMIGAVISYFIGAYGGLALVERYGKYVLFRSHELEKTNKLFDKFGAWLTLAGRCIPGVRTYIGYPAGVARMRFGVFLGATFIGSLVWSIVLSVAGYELSAKLGVIERIIREFGIVALLLALVIFIWYVYAGRSRASNS